jgi:predicted component of type VI protein secretion system
VHFPRFSGSILRSHTAKSLNIASLALFKLRGILPNERRAASKLSVYVAHAFALAATLQETSNY